MMRNINKRILAVAEFITRIPLIHLAKSIKDQKYPHSTLDDI